MDSTTPDELARRHGIRLLLQFGSSVSGREHASSDIDVAVLVDRVPDSFDGQADLFADLQALFPAREVDVAIINRADPLFLKQILESARLLYGATRMLHELRMYAFKPQVPRPKPQALSGSEEPKHHFRRPSR